MRMCVWNNGVASMSNVGCMIVHPLIDKSWMMKPYG